MRKTSIGRRWGVAAGMVVVAGAAGTAHAAPSQATKDRCTRYAQHSVQQYRLMKSRPECEITTDPLGWQENYDNHYNGCLLFPESMSKFGEQSRDNHLQACGALTDAAPAAGADCQTQRPAALPTNQTKVGFAAIVTNGSLSFHSVPQQGELQSYNVLRPAYISQQLACAGRADDRFGPWITLVGESGPEIVFVGADDAVFAAPLTAAAAQQLLSK